jgi:hypothetical protein
VEGLSALGSDTLQWVLCSCFFSVFSEKFAEVEVAISFNVAIVIMYQSRVIFQILFLTSCSMQ